MENMFEIADNLNKVCIETVNTTASTVDKYYDEQCGNVQALHVKGIKIMSDFMNAQPEPQTQLQSAFDDFSKRYNDYVKNMQGMFTSLFSF